MARTSLGLPRLSARRDHGNLSQLGRVVSSVWIHSIGARLRHALALRRNNAGSLADTQAKRPEQVLWVAVLTRAALDVRDGSEQEAVAVLGWIEREHQEFEQVVTLAGLEFGHAERFERAMRATFAARFRRASTLVGQGRALATEAGP